jgi:hypothetical protein
MTGSPVETSFIIEGSWYVADGMSSRRRLDINLNRDISLAMKIICSRVALAVFCWGVRVTLKPKR